MPVVTISDPEDGRLAEFRALNDAGARRRLEAGGPFGSGFFVGEGWLVLERVHELRLPIRAVLVDDRRLDRLGELLGRRLESTVVYSAPAAVIAAVVGFDLHRGVVATVDRPRPVDAPSLAAGARRLLVIEGITDAENLGVLFRNAAGLGADGVLLDPTVGDPLTRRTVRVSLGHVLTVPWARTPEPWRQEGYRVLALTPSPDAIRLDELAIEPGQPVALMVGAEGPGLSPEAIAAADDLVAIPMARRVDSINVASAAAIAMWHLFRVRDQAERPRPQNR